MYYSYKKNKAKIITLQIQQDLLLTQRLLLILLMANDSECLYQYGFRLSTDCLGYYTRIKHGTQLFNLKTM